MVGVSRCQMTLNAHNPQAFPLELRLSDAIDGGADTASRLGLICVGIQIAAVQNISKANVRRTLNIRVNRTRWDR